MAQSGTTLVVEPDHGGHHFQSVSFVVAEAGSVGPVVLLTSQGAAATEEFEAHLGAQHRAGDLVLVEALVGTQPPTADVARAVASCGASCAGPVHVLVMDGVAAESTQGRARPPGDAAGVPAPRGGVLRPGGPRHGRRGAPHR